MEIREGWVAVLLIAAVLLGAFVGALFAWSGVASDCHQLSKFQFSGKVYDCRQVSKVE